LLLLLYERPAVIIIVMVTPRIHNCITMLSFLLLYLSFLLPQPLLTEVVFERRRLKYVSVLTMVGGMKMTMIPRETPWLLPLPLLVVMVISSWHTVIHKLIQTVPAGKQLQWVINKLSSSSSREVVSFSGWCYVTNLIDSFSIAFCFLSERVPRCKD
jgi:hypothetical protein